MSAALKVQNSSSAKLRSTQPTAGAVAASSAMAATLSNKNNANTRRRLWRVRPHTLIMPLKPVRRSWPIAR